MNEATLPEAREGGPAFPVLDFPAQGGGNFFSLGLSARDYFAAHAPRRPWAHYKPVIAPKPEPEWGDIPNAERYDVDPLNWVARREWDVEYERQRELQWPYFYADAMLAQRSRS